MRFDSTLHFPRNYLVTRVDTYKTFYYGFYIKYTILRFLSYSYRPVHMKITTTHLVPADATLREGILCE